MRVVLRVLEGILLEAAGIFLNMAGVLGDGMLLIPGIVLSLGGLIWMTLALSDRWRESEGILGTSRDARTGWTIRLAAVFAVVSVSGSVYELLGGRAQGWPDMLLLIIGSGGILASFVFAAVIQTSH